MSAEFIPIAAKVAHKLTGSLDSISAILEQLELDPELEDEIEFCKELDKLVFCCTVCDWWYEQSENVNCFTDGEWKCRECAE